MNKSDKILKLLEEGKSINEIIKAVKCTKALVYQVRNKLGGDKADAAADTYDKYIETARELVMKNLREPLYAKKVGGNPIPDFLRQREDSINHPAHYTHGGIEAIDVIEAWELNYKLGNVLKYISRAPFKENYLQDLKKAQWYLNREIEQTEDAVAKDDGF